MGMDVKKILLADDEPALRFLLAETFADEGYDIAVAENGAQAIEMIADRAFDLLVLDYMMPEKNGVEVCDWLRKNGGVNREIPVVLLTAKSMEKDRELAKAAGVTEYMLKPFSPLQLLELVSGLLK